MNPMEQLRLKLSGVDVVKNALIDEAEKRRGRRYEQWREAEAKAVWAATCAFAQRHGLREPAMSEVIRIESQAIGHCDYSSKWALYAVELTFVAEPSAAI